MKAIIDVSNINDKFLPITKSIPVEMLPLIDKPIIDFILSELLGSGIKNILIISDRYKKMLEDYLDREEELENLFKKEQNKNKLNKIKLTSEDVNIHSQRIDRSPNSKHPIYQIKSFINNQPFIYVQPEFIVYKSNLIIKKMLESYSKSHLNIITLSSHGLTKERKYKFILNRMDKANKEFLFTIVPNISSVYPESSFSSIKRFILNPDFIDYLSEREFGFLDIDEILYLKRKELSIENIFKPEIINDEILNVSNLLEYIKSFTKYALTREEYKNDFDVFIRKIIGYNLNEN